MTLDAHIDLPWIMLKHGWFDIDIGSRHSSMSTLKMQNGGLNKAIFALYISDQIRHGLGDTLAYERILQEVTMLPEGHLTALEGGGVLGDDPVPRLRELNDIVKLRYLTLVHNSDLTWVESATDGTITWGIQDVGWEVILECERLGILVDVSHSSDETVRNVLGMSSKPVIASHSGSREMLDHPRNLSDQLIKGIAETGGMVCVPFAKRFVGSVVGIANHIDHIVELVGIDHVGIGSDLDGAVMVDAIRSVGDWSCWKEPLKDWGYTDDDIAKIAGRNLQMLLGLEELAPSLVGVS